MVLIVEDIGSAVFVIFFLLDGHSQLFLVFVFHVFLEAGILGKDFFFLRHHLLRLRHSDI